jgi:putative ABC transport system permease protein
VTTTANVPSWAGVLASVSLVLLAGFVTWRQRLGITRELLVAAARAFVQLVAVGALLLVVFERGGLLAAFAWLVVMTVIGGYVAGRRARGLPDATRVAGVAIAVGTASTMGVLLVLQVISLEPQVVIPVGGMVVSTAMATTAVTLSRTRDAVTEQRAAVEARLSLGLTAREAFEPVRRASVRIALTPAIDTTKVVGLISLPGAMTGLILAGVDPLEAIRYQIVVMYMLLAAAALATMVASRLAESALFDEGERLRQVPAVSG